MKVIGTAGHIDHGKSTLVHRLTGIDPDRLEEEKRRGMTIDLGFAWVTLPSGTEVSIVDVPGHERFVKNMLAGAAGIDVALLVVAADESVMPQTREHLDIVHLLGISQGVVAVTKSDLVDEEWLALVEDDVRTLLAGTRLADAPIVGVSATRGHGIQPLLQALDTAVAAAPERPRRGSPFLPVDRVFTASGFGTVAAGTLHGGEIRQGQDVEILPVGKRGRIRSMQTHGRTVENGSPGDRLALNIAGVERAEVARGDVVAPPGMLRATNRFDGRISVLPDAPKGVKHGLQASVHIGSAERSATISVLSGDAVEPGADGWVQVRVTEPVVAVPGQRFVVRLPAPARTVAGGEVVDAVPRHRRRDPVAVKRLERLASPAMREGVLAALTAGRPRRVPQIAAVTGHTEAAVRGELNALVKAREVAQAGDWYVEREGWATQKQKVKEILTDYHAANPLKDGMPREELRARSGWPSGPWGRLLQSLEADGMVRVEGPVVALASFSGPATRGPLATRVLDLLGESPYSPTAGEELLKASGASDELLRALAREGEIVRIENGIYLRKDAYREMSHYAVQRARESGSVSVIDVRDRFETSRKYALALLEFLDGERITRRHGDAHVLGSKADACASD